MLAVAIPAMSAVTARPARQANRAARRSHPLALRQARHPAGTPAVAFDLDANAYGRSAQEQRAPAREGERRRTRAHPGPRGVAGDASRHVRRGPREAELAQKSAFQASNDVPKTELGGFDAVHRRLGAASSPSGTRPARPISISGPPGSPRTHRSISPRARRVCSPPADPRLPPSPACAAILNPAAMRRSLRRFSENTSSPWARWIDVVLGEPGGPEIEIGPCRSSTARAGAAPRRR